MNNLITNTPVISSVLVNGALTMSSREISDICGARHNDVVSTIERLFENGVLRESRKTTRAYRPEKGGRPTEVYDLTKRDTLVVVSGYNDDVRAKIIDRWIELEGTGQRSAFIVPKNLSEALRLAADQAEQIEEMKPVVAAYDRLAKAHGSVCLTDAAKMCQMKPQAFIRYLNAEHWIYRRVGSPAWIGYAEHLDNGDLEHKYTTVQRDDGTEKITTQARMTAQGITKLCLKLGIPAPAFDKQGAFNATV